MRWILWNGEHGMPGRSSTTAPIIVRALGRGLDPAIIASCDDRLAEPGLAGRERKAVGA